MSLSEQLSETLEGTLNKEEIERVLNQREQEILTKRFIDRISLRKTGEQLERPICGNRVRDLQNVALMKLKFWIDRGRAAHELQEEGKRLYEKRQKDSDRRKILINLRVVAWETYGRPDMLEEAMK